MTRGEITGRADASFWRYSPLLQQRLKAARYPLAAIGSLVTEEPDYGSGARAAERISPSQPRYIRITDFGDDGIEPNHEFASPDPIEESCALEVNDLLFARSGATVGKTYLHEDASELAIFAGYCIRFRLAPNRALPRFVYWFTKTRAYELWVLATQRPAGQPNINKEEYKTLDLPLPQDTTVQAKLVLAMDEARTTRREKLAQADALLAGLDGYLSEILGLAPPTEDGRRVFAVNRNQVPRRFDPHFHSPDFIQIVRTLDVAGAVPLGTLVNFSNETWKPELHDEATFRYIEISGVSPKDGVAVAEEVPTTEAPSRARMVSRTGDIIVSLTRPHHGSIAQITDDLDGCIASTGFSVIREVKGSVSRDYLWCVLRSRLSLKQMLQRASGGNYPAITEPELANVLIPLPSQAIQEQIAAEVRRRREEARELRTEAEAGWQAAKAWFEAQLLGDATGQGAISVRPETAGVATEMARSYEPRPHFKATTGQQSRTHDGASRHVSDDAPLYPLAAEPPAVAPARGQAALPAANQPVPGGIPQRLLAAMQPGRAYARAELLAATGISEADWIWAIRQLKEEWWVVQEGEKRGTRYMLAGK